MKVYWYEVDRQASEEGDESDSGSDSLEGAAFLGKVVKAAADELGLKPESGDVVVSDGHQYEVMNLGGEGSAGASVTRT